MAHKYNKEIDEVHDNDELETLKIILNSCKNLESIKIRWDEFYLDETDLFDVISLDWTIPSACIHLLRHENPRLILQGNLDPCALYSSKENLEKFVNRNQWCLIYFDWKKVLRKLS